MPPLTHLVLLKVRPDVPDRDVDGALAALRGLARKIHGVTGIDAGPDVSVEGLAQGHTHAAVVTFVDEAARDGYLPHPAHLAVVEQLTPLVDGLTVIDLATA